MDAAQRLAGVRLIVVHGGLAHMDDIMSCAIAYAFGVPHDAPIERRNPTPDELDSDKVLVMDVGGVHDPARLDFDHHQRAATDEPKCAFRLLAEWLGADAGILAGSALPGEGLSVIAAHNTLNDTAYGPFALLSTMEPGDRIFTAADDGTLHLFRVYASELLAPDDMASIEAMAEGNALVLVTCENESAEGGYLNRRVVFAK